MTYIRTEQPSDVPAIRRVNEAAFGRSAEADLVDKLRIACQDALSMVATCGDDLVGHILFSPVIVSDGTQFAHGMGLAPMAVLPERQRLGIGSRLVRAGIDELRRRNCPFVVVLGHPEFYPRFGFAPSSRHSLNCQWENVPDDVFMVLILDEATMTDVAGTVRYRDEFNDVA